MTVEVRSSQETSAVPALIAAAKARGGWVAAEQIDAITADATAEEVTALYDALHQAGVRIEDEDEADAVATQQQGDAGPSTDPVRLYLRSIGATPLLKQADEVMLGATIEAGALAERLLQAPAECSSEQVRDLLERCGFDPVLGEGHREALARVEAAGHAARRRLIEANLRLVVSIAKRFMGRGLSFLDLIQEGNLGLIRAVEKFDHRRGFKFSTYATWWIRQAVTRAIADQSRTIRIPVHLVDLIYKIVKTQRQLLQNLNREPTIDEVADVLQMPPTRIAEIMRISQDPVSLEAPLGQERSASIGETIEDTHAIEPGDAAGLVMMQEQLEAIMGTLTDRERRVIEMRYGMADGTVRTLEEVGREFGVTRERIRQIESKTLSKLRHPSRLDQLRDYLD